MLRAEEVTVALGFEDVFLAVEEDEIDADLALDVLHRMGQFHEQGDAGAAVVGAEERLLPVARVGFLVGDRPGVVVRADQDPPLPLGEPGDDHVGHFGRLLPAVLLRLETLVGHLGAFGLEVLLHQLLLAFHAVGAADARADAADIFEVAHRPLGVEGDRQRWQAPRDRRRTRCSSGGPHGTTRYGFVHDQAADKEEDGGQANAAGQGGVTGRQPKDFRHAGSPPGEIGNHAAIIAGRRKRRETGFGRLG